MGSEKYQQDWEELAQLDPLWAILVKREKRYGRWELGEFFRTGEREVNDVVQCLTSLGIEPKFDKVLDFGCGVGRVTRALSKHCNLCYGIDVSPTMIKLAKQFVDNNDSKCRFILNEQPDLSIFEDDFFDFIYSILVLQHIPDREEIKSYIAEFIRVVKPSGHLYFQLPSYTNIPFIARFRRLFQLNRHLYTVLKLLGLPREFLYRKLRVSLMDLMEMNYVPVNEVKQLFDGKAQIIDILSKDLGECISTRYLVKRIGK